MRGTRENRHMPQSQPIQHISRVPHGRIGCHVAIGADGSQQLDVVERGDIRQSQRVVDAGIDIENQLAFDGHQTHFRNSSVEMFLATGTVCTVLPCESV